MSKLYHGMSRQQHMYHVNFPCNVTVQECVRNAEGSGPDPALVMRAIFIAAAQLEPDGLPIRPPFGGAQVAVFHAVDQLRAPEFGGGAIGYSDLVSPPP